MQDVALSVKEIVEGKGYVILPDLFTPKDTSPKSMELLCLRQRHKSCANFQDQASLLN